VGISGNTAFVGALDDDDALGVNQGSAYSYVRAGASWGNETKFMATDAAAGVRFGTSVGVDGATAVIGSPSKQAGIVPAAGAGGAYGFRMVIP
jgi:hypothetical protein